jgi:hypothetical protein
MDALLPTYLIASGLRGDNGCANHLPFVPFVASLSEGLMGTVHPPNDIGDPPVPFDDQIAGKLVGHTVAEVERVLIIRTLSDAEWNRTRAATTLGISVRCLRNKIHEFKKQGIAIPAANRTRPEFTSSADCRWLRSQG